MGFDYYPTFQISGKGEPRPVQDELKRLKIHARMVGADAVIFSVRERTEFMGQDVWAVHAETRWEVSHNSQKEVYVFKDEEGRTWKAESDVGASFYHALLGISKGEVTGSAACDFLFRLFLELEVASGHGYDHWIGEYFPKFYKHHRDKIEKRRLKQVKDVMES